MVKQYGIAGKAFAVDKVRCEAGAAKKVRLQGEIHKKDLWGAPWRWRLDRMSEK